MEYNFRPADFRPPAGQDSSGLDEFASSVAGTDWATYRREGPGVSVFARQDASSTTPTRRARPAWTACGACTSGSTARHPAACWGAERSVVLSPPPGEIRGEVLAGVAPLVGVDHPDALGPQAPEERQNGGALAVGRHATEPGA